MIDYEILHKSFLAWLDGREEVFARDAIMKRDPIDVAEHRGGYRFVSEIRNKVDELRDLQLKGPKHG